MLLDTVLTRNDPVYQHQQTPGAFFASLYPFIESLTLTSYGDEVYSLNISKGRWLFNCLSANVLLPPGALKPELGHPKQLEFPSPAILGRDVASPFET